MEDWLAAERTASAAYRKIARAENKQVVPPEPSELEYREDDSRFWGAYCLVSGIYNEKWASMEAPIVENARKIDSDHCRAMVARYDEIRIALRDWLAARFRADEAVNLPGLRVAHAEAQAVAVSLRRRLIAHQAQTRDELLAKLTNVCKLIGASHFETEISYFLKKRPATIDDVLVSVARDAARLATPKSADVADPILALIEGYKTAFAAYVGLEDGDHEPGAPEADAHRAAREVADRALEALLDGAPQTVAGARTVLEFLGEIIGDGLEHGAVRRMLLRSPILAE